MIYANLVVSNILEHPVASTGHNAEAIATACPQREVVVGHDVLREGLLVGRAVCNNAAQVVIQARPSGHDVIGHQFEIALGREDKLGLNFIGDDRGWRRLWIQKIAQNDEEFKNCKNSP
jgi:hypothetical protein